MEGLDREQAIPGVPERGGGAWALFIFRACHGSDYFLWVGSGRVGSGLNFSTGSAKT